MLRLLLIFITVGSLVSFSTAQAAVEGALTHGLAGTASAGAGKALGQISNQLAGRMGQQTSNAIHPVVTTVKPGTVKNATIPKATTPPASGSSMIASIQGGESQTPETACSSEPQAKTSQDSKKTSGCSSKKALAAEQATHPSEITLPAAK